MADNAIHKVPLGAGLSGELAAANFPPGAAVPIFHAGHPNAGPTLKNPIMGAPPYNGVTGPASKK